MADYIKVYETSNADEVNTYIKNGWELIGTYKIAQSDEYGDNIGNYAQYSLGLSLKEYANKLVAIIKEYEKHGLKEVLFEKVAGEQGEQSGKDSPLAKFMVNYEDMISIKENPNTKKDNDDVPFILDKIDF